MRPPVAPVLQIIIASTRPGRNGPAIAKWFYQRAVDHGGFDVELVDLADYHLPVLDEPHHPRLRKYTQDHTKAWSATIDRADAIVFVHPEYNHSISGGLKNAMDYLYHEWGHKPVGVIPYGGISGGLRAAQTIKQIIVALRMFAAANAVPIPYFFAQIKDGVFTATEAQDRAADTMLDELLTLANGTADLREQTRRSAPPLS